MNDVTHTGFGDGSPATMTTREIADLTGKEHRHVMRDAEAMLVTLELAAEGYVQNWTHPQNGQTYRELALPKDLTITLVSGYDVKTRHKIIVRWQELEARIAPPAFAIPASYSEALRLAADNADRAEKAEAKLELAAPKVAFAEQVEAAPDAISISQAAKLLDTGRNRLMAKLKEWQWVTRLGEPYQDKINAGLLGVKVGSWEHPEKGLQRSVTALVTGKGLSKLYKLHFPGGTPPQMNA